MIEVEVFGEDLEPGGPDAGRGGGAVRARRARLGVGDGHVAVEFVSAARIHELNLQHRGRDAPTDVLSFPIDGAGEAGEVPREIGDIVICPEHTSDVREAVLHGMLHLLGMDHESDDGEMLELQGELLRSARR